MFWAMYLYAACHVSSGCMTVLPTPINKPPYVSRIECWKEANVINKQLQNGAVAVCLEVN